MTLAIFVNFFCNFWLRPRQQKKNIFENHRILLLFFGNPKNCPRPIPVEIDNFWSMLFCTLWLPLCQPVVLLLFTEASNTWTNRMNQGHERKHELHESGSRTNERMTNWLKHSVPYLQILMPSAPHSKLPWLVMFQNKPMEIRRRSLHCADDRHFDKIMNVEGCEHVTCLWIYLDCNTVIYFCCTLEVSHFNSLIDSLR